MTRFRQADFDRLNHHNQLTGGIEFWNLEFICDLEFGTWNLLAQSPKINAFTASTKYLRFFPIVAISAIELYRLHCLFYIMHTQQACAIHQRQHVHCRGAVECRFRFGS